MHGLTVATKGVMYFQQMTKYLLGFLPIISLLLSENLSTPIKRKKVENSSPSKSSVKLMKHFQSTVALMRIFTISPTDANSFENNYTNQRKTSTLAVKYV